MTDAHDQTVTHTYHLHYPEHEARAGDPHYVDFEHIRAAWSKDPAKWRCAVGAHRGDFGECDAAHPLELHHAHVEFALQNAIDLRWLAVDYPGIDDPAHVGAWVESAANLMVLCRSHHRGAEGVHLLSSADYEAAKYVRGLTMADPTSPTDGQGERL